MFIELTNRNGEKILFNISKIKNVMEMGEGSIINYHSKMQDSIIVKESYKSVKEIIRNSLKNY